MKTNIRRLFIFGLRSMTLLAKFALTLFITRFLGLEAMGLYGLILGAAALAPFVFGFGLYSLLNRHIVDMPLHQAMPSIMARFTLTSVIYAVLLPTTLAANQAMGSPLPMTVALLAAVIVFFEHLGIDAHGVLTSRHRPNLATVLFFVRSGLWMFIYMALALFIEPLRHFEMMLYFWLGGSGLTLLVLVALLIAKGRYRMISFDFGWIKESVPKGRYMYLFEVGNIGGQFIDRFFITFLLGLEAAGIYVFFWSLSNAAYNLVYFSVVQPNNPHVIGAAKKGDQGAFRKAVFTQQKAGMIWGGLCCLAVLAAAPVLIDILDKPAIADHFWIIALLLPAALIRLGADTLQNAIYAKGKDKVMGLICLVSLLSSAVFLCILTPLWGLLGASIAALATNLTLLGMRVLNALPLLHLEESKTPVA